MPSIASGRIGTQKSSRGTTEGLGGIGRGLGLFAFFMEKPDLHAMQELNSKCRAVICSGWKCKIIVSVFNQREILN
jgi:hypothetical protein